MAKTPGNFYTYNIYIYICVCVCVCVCVLIILKFISKMIYIVFILLDKENILKNSSYSNLTSIQTFTSQQKSSFKSNLVTRV